MVHVKIVEICVPALVCMHNIYSFELVERRGYFVSLSLPNTWPTGGIYVPSIY